MWPYVRGRGSGGGRVSQNSGGGGNRATIFGAPRVLRQFRGGCPTFSCARYDRGDLVARKPGEIDDFEPASRAAPLFGASIQPRQRREHKPEDPILFYTGRLFSPRVLGIDSSRGESSEGKELHEVRIIDNDYNTYREVMDITMLALGISEEQAFAVAWEVDHRGSCVVAVGPYPEAEVVANIIRTIGIEVQVNAVAEDSA